MFFHYFLELKMITLSQTHLKEIQEHGKEAYPEECCGAMLGNFDKEISQKNCTQIIRIENNWGNNWENNPEKSHHEESRHRRFAVTADDYRQLEKQAKETGLTLLGFYHTHPDHPALPSGTDLSYAWPFFSYIIQSINKGEVADIFSYELDVDKEEFVSEDMQVELK